MATYYVRTDGNDSNTGLGPATNQAWLTITKALGATGIGSGDTLYIAPGDYRQNASITVGGTYTAPTFVYGNPTASQFSGITPGRVLITTRLISDTGASNVNQYLILMTSKDYLNFENLIFETGTNRSLFYMINCVEIKWRKCLFMNSGLDSAVASADTSVNGLTKNYLFQQCHFVSMANGGCFVDGTPGKNSPATQDYVYGLTVDRCVCIGSSNANFSINGSGTYQGSTFTFLNNTGFGINFGQGAGKSLVTIRNNVTNAGQTINVTAGTANCTVTNNVAYSFSLQAAIVQSNNFSNPYVPFNTGIWRLWGMTQYDWFSANGLYTYATGSSTGTPATDFYGDVWAGGTPNIGSYNNTTATIAGQYNPTERNASTITIAPGSTSQSIELYLGATGLTASTAGLTARYNRTRTASVDIPLVARTIGQAWISGGFAEVDAVNMPGVYRVDIPDAALAAGADDVTLVVRGASGTNGAVMTVKLSSGGLTSGQTASAVWGAAVAGYNTALDFGGVINDTRNVVGATETYVLDVPNQVWDESYTTHTAANTFGARVLKTTVDNRLVDVGTSQHIHANVHAIVDSTVAAVELSGALLHNGTDYISADLLSPATPATTLRMGPYSVVADQTKQEINVDILTGASLPVVLQLVDANGTGIPLTGATLSVKIYTTSGTLVATYTGTASYADAGFVTFTLTSAVTATPGTYYVTVTRSSGATDTSIYGGLRLYVRSN
jgi:hypothetical protein